MKNTGKTKYPTKARIQKGFAFGKIKIATETQKHRIENVFFCVSVPPWQKNISEGNPLWINGKSNLRKANHQRGLMYWQARF